MQLSRSDFLKASLATFGVAVAGCSESDPGVGGAGGTGGLDGATGGTGGIGTGGAASGGAGTGGAGTGGQASGGTGTGGAGTGGTATGGAGTGGAGGDVCSSDITVTSSGNHQHTLTVTAAQIAAGTEVTITTSSDGQGPHDHEVTITAAHFTALKNGEHVTITGCDFHFHEYVLSCADGAPAPGTVDTCP